MKNKKLTISGLATSLLLGLAVISFAGTGSPNYHCCADQTTNVCTNPVQSPDLNNSSGVFDNEKYILQRDMTKG